MGTFTIKSVKERGLSKSDAYETISVALREAVRQQEAVKAYDIFLSHSFKDAELILGIKTKLEDFGYSVYVDWLEDSSLDRSYVTPTTAVILRKRMSDSRCLLYSTSETSSNSKWMPWECGYADGKKGKVAILPLTETSSESYKGQEYLGIYPYIVEAVRVYDNKRILRVASTPEVYCSFDEWLKGTDPYRH